MYPFYPQYRIQQPFSLWFNQSFLPQSVNPLQPFTKSHYALSRSNVVNHHPPNINKDPRTLSNTELINLLDKHTNVLKRLHVKDQQHQLPILIDVLTILTRVPKSTLVSTLQNEFFSLVRIPLCDILNQWSRQVTSLSEDEVYVFRSMTRLIRRLIKATHDVTLIPSSLSDSSLLEPIAKCLTDISTSSQLFNQNNRSIFKYFVRLIDAYIHYQQRLNDENHLYKDTLHQLLDPIVECLSSSQYIHIFTNLPTDATSLATVEKFFLLKCPSFLISYNGSHLEQTMDHLLSIMLPQYVQLFDKLVLKVHSWKRATMESVHHLLKIINHGSNHFQTNAKLVGQHLSLIDNVLKLVNEPILYNNLRETLSNIETNLMNTAINFLVNMINEPTILAHIKQCQVTNVFLRLTSCQYEPLVFGVYALLAYTTHEEDIKAMSNPGRLLATIIKSLKTTLNKMPDNKSHKEQLLETLKGLIQHDQIKDEVIKQNALPFLLECANKLTDRAHILILEILWSLTFREESLLALRSNDKFLDEIQTISKDGNNEPLKKAADGLVWKLIREPAFLKKVTQQEEEEKNAAKEVIETIVEEIVNFDGQKELVTTIKPVMISNEERTFEYDIMISYCHSDKDLTYKIHKFLLDQGFKVWIDLDNMYGPAMTAMADAVENSEFVIMCMSDSYKQSTYCQAEAEYAFNCKRRLIPLIMRPGYKPDGWLGFMIGSRIYVDYGRFDFETACEKLLTEINRQRKQPIALKPVQNGQHEIPSTQIETKQEIYAPRRERSLPTHNNHSLTVHTKRKPKSDFIHKPVIQWTDSDVLDFLYSQRLIQLMSLCDTMDGRTLIQLYKMCLSHSSKVYTLLSDELKSTYKTKLPIVVYTRFLSAMEQRLSTPPATAVARTILKPPVAKVTKVIKPPEYIPQPPKKPVVANIPYQYPSYPNQPYDLIITSDAPALDVLRAIERYGPNFQKMSTIPMQYSGRF